MAEWGLEEWGLDEWGLGFTEPPTVTPLYPAENAIDVLPWAYLTFVIADQDTNINLMQTEVHVARWVGGVWVSEVAYTRGSFIGTWIAESATAAYSGAYGTGYDFSCREGADTWGNNTLTRITVTTADFDTPAQVATKIWYFTSIKAFDVVSTELVGAKSLLVTFTNQVADVNTAVQNARSTSVSLVTRSTYDVGSVVGISKEINSSRVIKITRGVGMLPNQLLLSVDKLTAGESYALAYGTYDAATVPSPTAGVDLQDMYGQLLGARSYLPKFFSVKPTKADSVLDRVRRAGFDTSENSNVAGILGAIGRSDDALGGSGSSRNGV